MFARARRQDGFGLIEVLVAMTILNIGILAIVAAFNSGIVAINRSSKISTASALADAQMELYRGAQYGSITLGSATIPATAPYTSDTSYDATQVTGSCSPASAMCNASQTLTGADHKYYRVDTYIVLSTDSTVPPTPTNGRPLKIVTVVVRDTQNLTAPALARVTSTFDASTG